MNKGLLVVGLVVCAAMSFRAFADDFRQRGYFKDKSGLRVFSVELGDGVDAGEALAYARQKTYSRGGITAVYFYRPGARMPIDGITLAQSYAEVNRVLYEIAGLDAWRFAYMRGFSGRESFVVCRL